MSMAIFLAEAMLKVTQNCIRNHYMKDEPCSLMMAALVEGRAHQNYLRSLGALRLAGVVLQLTLSILLAVRFRRNGKDDLLLFSTVAQAVRFCCVVSFLKVAFSSFVFLYSPFSTYLIRRKAALRGQNEQGNAERRVLALGEELAALVWFFHCQRHPSLPPVCAFRREEYGCGLPGHWFLGRQELISIALSRGIHGGGTVSLKQEMALDALGRLVERGARDTWDAVVDRERRGFDRLVNIVSDHSSVRCREKAVIVIWQLADIGRKAEEDGYDPLKSYSTPRMVQAGAALLNAALSGSSPLLQEKAMGALWRLSREHGSILECLFGGAEGRDEIEKVVGLARKAPTPKCCLESMYLLSRLMANLAAPYAHYTEIATAGDIEEVRDGRLTRARRCREPATDMEGYKGLQRFWVPTSRGCFRESTALPQIITFALSPDSSTDAKELVAVIIQCYFVLGPENLFVYEIRSLVRILRVRYYSTAVELLYAAMLTCDLLLHYFTDPGTTNSPDLLPQIIEHDDSMLFVYLLRLQSEHWMGPQFAVQDAMKIIPESGFWRQFISPLREGRRPTVRHLLRSPARLMAYLLSTQFDLLTVEIEEVFLDDTVTRRSTEINDSIADEGYLAGMTICCFGLALLFHEEETRTTKLNACVALTRLAKYDGRKLRPYVAEACKYLQKDRMLDLREIQGTTEVAELKHELSDCVPGLDKTMSGSFQRSERPIFQNAKVNMAWENLNDAQKAIFSIIAHAADSQR
ncbi:hypothetical protein CBR_g38580 [Chara braunii]|uniref:Uncharacterized protein n=1 Tax=Chara braunii TaxID=69332 RepID=A0A388K0E8_CHABU|nr:hypothetical protein CBR_g38580 [Chara braunii]|eukprot:GBG63512.1 hypothetical protein CBR_g38580 [Chara braunii]